MDIHLSCLLNAINIDMQWIPRDLNSAADRPVTRGGARGAFAPPPTGPKGPHFDTHYPS